MQEFEELKGDDIGLADRIGELNGKNDETDNADFSDADELQEDEQIMNMYADIVHDDKA